MQLATRVPRTFEINLIAFHFIYSKAIYMRLIQEEFKAADCKVCEAQKAQQWHIIIVNITTTHTVQGIIMLGFHLYV